MHDYLRAIGFSKIKKNKDVRDILNLVMLRPTSEYVSSAGDDEEAVFGEKAKEFADRMGISVRGEYDESGQFHFGYYFPYFKAKNCTIKDEVTIEKQSDKDAYAGICDNVKVGVSLIFQLLNMADYIDYTEFHKGSLFYAPMYLSGLSVSGKVILPLMKTKEDVRRRKDESINRDRMIAADPGRGSGGYRKPDSGRYRYVCDDQPSGKKRRCFDNCRVLFYALRYCL